MSPGDEGAQKKKGPTLIAPTPKSVAEIAAQIRPSLVKVVQEGRDGPSGIGSGFVIDSSGLIATNRHVIGEGRRITVETSDGKSLEVIEVVANDSLLDLAILRVRGTSLMALEFGDSDKLRQGDPIIAMGNPKGLTFSVVAGVVSEPRREIDGQPMIQVAIPIEQGNSGGPLLDEHGKVLGVLTLKSALAQNLGFAMPSNLLRKLIDKPNPIPMERWLTIGVLNPRLWQPLMGAQWTQRAGSVNVTHPGSGFGGRSLCLWREKPPEHCFEASVAVRLEEESGAAGLAFCSDLDQRHYGFYPTNGKLRLTRFDGKDVFTWQILAEVSSQAYHPGEWNTLKIHVEDQQITCSVNGEIVLDLKDAELRGGHSGLCKFRNTIASFKNFKVGGSLNGPTASPEEDDQARDLLATFLDGTTSHDAVLSRFLKDPIKGRSFLEAGQRRLEVQADRVRNLVSELHRRAIAGALRDELEKGDPTANLLRCALLLSKFDNPDLDIESYEQDFQHMADELRELPEIHAGTKSAVERLKQYLFQENGFHGSRVEYNHRSNSYINEAMDDREGLPITLSVIFLEMARRLGINEVVGIPLPGRFMIGFRANPQDAFSIIDVFEGGKGRTFEEALAAVGADGELPERFTKPASTKEILLRMIRNLLGQASDSKLATQDTLPYIDLVLVLDPESNQERVARALLRERSGDKKGAAADVRWMLEQHHGSLPDEQREMLQRWLDRLGR